MAWDRRFRFPFVIIVSEKPKKRIKILKYIIFLQRALSYVILNVEIIENSADGRQSLWMSIKRECLLSNGIEAIKMP